MSLGNFGGGAYKSGNRGTQVVDGRNGLGHHGQQREAKGLKTVLGVACICDGKVLSATRGELKRNVIQSLGWQRLWAGRTRTPELPT